MKRSRLSRGGIAGPGLVSVLYPYAPPAFLSDNQYTGGTYSYGPVIFTPEAPVTVVAVSEAEETDGLRQSSSFRMPKYVFSTSAGGGLSLPLSHTNTLGCWRKIRIWLRKDAAETSCCSSFHFGHCSHASQQVHPGITKIPSLSVLLKNSSRSSRPSSRMVFIPMSC